MKLGLISIDGSSFEYKVKPYNSDSVVYGSYTNSSCDTCGHYYTWAAAMDSAGVFSFNALGCGNLKSTCNALYPVRGICPEGWHLPSGEEWETLVNEVGGEYAAGPAFKSRSDWKNDGNGSDAYGFTVLPVGRRDCDSEKFISVGYCAYIWGSTEVTYTTAPDRTFGETQYFTSSSDRSLLVSVVKTYANPVRCLKDPD